MDIDFANLNFSKQASKQEKAAYRQFVQLDKQFSKALAELAHVNERMYLDLNENERIIFDAYVAGK